jgi:hypothetical protein
MTIVAEPNRGGERDPAPVRRGELTLRRSTLEMATAATAILFGAVGVLAHLWLLDAVGLLAGCVGLGMLIVRWLPDDDHR